jgi:hypothetical protein
MRESAAFSNPIERRDMKKRIVGFIISVIVALVATVPASAAVSSAQVNSRQGGNHGVARRMHQGRRMNQHHMNQNGNHAQNNNHVQVKLNAVGNSGISGLVNLNQRGNQEGTHIVVVAFGLQPGDQYISLYYDNHVCELEPYSPDDVIGGIYTANNGGVGSTEGNADDDLDEINSVSVRHAGDFELLACANVHP